MFPLQYFSGFSPKTAVAVVVISAALLFGGLFVYQVYANPLPQAHIASTAGTVYLSPSAEAAAQAAAAPPAAQTSMLEMHIANDGLVLLRGARVVSISGPTMQVSMSWGAGTFVWNVSTTNNTEFFAATGAKETLGDVQVGDTITITGMLSSGGAQPAVAATIVHE